MTAPAVTIEGVQGLVRKLERMERRTRARYLRRATSAAGTKLAQAVRRAAPVDTGLLRRSIGRRVRTYRKGAIATAIVGPRRGFEREVTGDDGQVHRVDPARYGNPVQARTNFMGTGAHQAEGGAVRAFGDNLGKAIEQEAAKR